MNRIKTALISVWDKTGVIDLAKFLNENNIEIISTGGTKKMLEDNGINVISVSDITNQKEVMDGRVKTLHPKIFGGILADRANENHLDDLLDMGGKTLDLIVVNLYPFKSEAIDKELSLEKAIEYIDIGGPSMLRAAAKNHQNIIPLCDPSQYSNFMKSYNLNSGIIDLSDRVNYATSVFKLVADYNMDIANYFSKKDNDERVQLDLVKVDDLRYGENPHQNASFYLPENTNKNWEQHHGKQLSYNNYYDIETANSIVYEFDDISCVIIKHSNPCGFAVGETLKLSYLSAVSTDPISYFGGIVAFNREVDLEVAIELNKSFLECIVAPSFSEYALAELKKKKNLRLITMNATHANKKLIRSVFNGFLIQDRDIAKENFSDFEIVSKIKPTNDQLKALYLGWNLVKYVKSNAIVFSNNKQLIGVGAGQMSRVDSVKIAINKAKNSNLSLKNTIMASDAFFPFSDSIQLAAEEGVAGVIQPGGSIKDEEVLEEINKQSMFMIITNKRHFNH